MSAMHQRGTESASKTSGWKNVLRWPAFLLANVVVFALVGISTVRETYRGWSVDQEIHTLQAQADTLEGRKSKLLELAGTLASDQQVELEARRRLGWKKDGEQVFVLTGYHPSSTSALGAAELGIPDEPAPKSIPSQWFDYFMHPSKN